MKYYTICFFVLSLCNFSHIYSQETQNEVVKDSTTTTAINSMSLWETLKYDGASTWGGIKHTYTQPFKWKGKDWAKFGGIAAGTALIYLIDESARDFFKDQGEDIPGAVQEIGFRFGKPIVNYGLTTGVYAFGLLTKNEKVRKTGVLLIASATAGGIIQTISKTLAGRSRPEEDKGNGDFNFNSSKPGQHSFPSGHSILSFTTAYAIGKQFKNPYIKGGIYALGLVSPVSRLWADAHWLTDVTLGVVMSVVVVNGIDKYLYKSKRYVYDPKKFSIKWDFNVGVGQLGVVGTF